MAVDGCLELQSVNNPAVKQGSPPCGINKTEELVKGMVEGRNTSSLPLMNVQQSLERQRRIFPPSDVLTCGSKGRFFWLSRSRRFLCSGKTSLVLYLLCSSNQKTHSVNMAAAIGLLNCLSPDAKRATISPQQTDSLEIHHLAISARVCLALVILTNQRVCPGCLLKVSASPKFCSSVAIGVRLSDSVDRINR